MSSRAKSSILTIYVKLTHDVRLTRKQFGFSECLAQIILLIAFVGIRRSKCPVSQSIDLSIQHFALIALVIHQIVLIFITNYFYLLQIHEFLLI